MTAPVREVTRVMELRGPRGGLILVHVLECGCFVTRRTPATRIPCISCWVREQVEAVDR